MPNSNADGAYDQHEVYDVLVVIGLTATGIHIPPQKNAKIWQHGNGKAPWADCGKVYSVIHRTVAKYLKSRQVIVF